MVKSLATGLAERGHRSRVIAILGEDPAERCLAFEDLRHAGVDVTEIRVPPRSYRAERMKLASALAGTGAVVHTHGYHADWIGLQAARDAGRPILSTVHGFTGGGWKNRLYEWLDVRALRKFDAVVPVSRPLVDRLQRSGIDRERLRLIINAWIPAPVVERALARERLGLSGNGVSLGWVGRLTHEKGADVFLAAMAQLPGEASASFVGNGPMRALLESQAVQLGVSDRVHWHGVVPSAGSLLRAFDVLVLSSHTEGTPMVLLEAMAAEVPIVATAVGGVPDILSAEQAALVPAGRPDLLAQAVASVLANPGAARARCAAARARLESGYAMGPWLDQYETVYRELAGSRTGR